MMKKLALAAVLAVGSTAAFADRAQPTGANRDRQCQPHRTCRGRDQAAVAGSG